MYKKQYWEYAYWCEDVKGLKLYNLQHKYQTLIVKLATLLQI